MFVRSTDRGRASRSVAEVRRQPRLHLFDRNALAARVLLDLIPADLAHREVARLGMVDVEPAHRSGRPHGEALGETDSDARLDIQEAEEGALLGVIRTGGIAGSGTDAAIALADQVFLGQILLRAEPALDA